MILRCFFFLEYSSSHLCIDKIDFGNRRKKNYNSHENVLKWGCHKHECQNINCIPINVSISISHRKIMTWGPRAVLFCLCQNIANWKKMYWWKYRSISNLYHETWTSNFVIICKHCKLTHLKFHHRSTNPPS